MRPRKRTPWRGWFAAVLTGVALLAVAACGSSSAGKTSAANASGGTTSSGKKSFFIQEVERIDGNLPVYNGSGKVGFSIYTGSVPHWEQQDIPGIRECLSTYAPNVGLVTSNPEAEAEKQTSQVSSMLTQGITVLLIAPVTSTPTTIMRDAHQDNVPVIAYVDPIEHAAPGEVVAMIGDGPEPVGEAQGKWVLAQKYPKGTEIALINGDLATQYAQLMQQYQMKELKPALESGELKLVASVGSRNWEGAEAEKEANAILVAHPNVKVIIAGADFLATGIINALKTVHKVGKVDIIGLEGSAAGLQQMLLGEQKATVIKSSYHEAAVGCAALIYTLMKKPVPKSVFNQTWSRNTSPIPFRNTEVATIEKGEIGKAFEWRIVTKEEVCKPLSATVGPPCSGS